MDGLIGLNVLKPTKKIIKKTLDKPVGICYNKDTKEKRRNIKMKTIIAVVSAIVLSKVSGINFFACWTGTIIVTAFISASIKALQ